MEGSELFLYVKTYYERSSYYRRLCYTVFKIVNSFSDIIKMNYESLAQRTHREGGKNY